MLIFFLFARRGCKQNEKILYKLKNCLPCKLVDTAKCLHSKRGMCVPGHKMHGHRITSITEGIQGWVQNLKMFFGYRLWHNARTRKPTRTHARTHMISVLTHVISVMKPSFDRLGDEAFLAGCENCYTQNVKESLHHVIWGMAPEVAYSSPHDISTAISPGELQFNRAFH